MSKCRPLCFHSIHSVQSPKIPISVLPQKKKATIPFVYQLWGEANVRGEASFAVVFEFPCMDPAAEKLALLSYIYTLQFSSVKV